MKHTWNKTLVCAKASPKALALALALVFLVLPAAPAVPIPTVGGSAHAAGSCDGIRSMVRNLEAQMDAAWVGGPHQNNDVIRYLSGQLRSAEEALAECETSCPYPLMFMAAGLSAVGLIAGTAAVALPEPTSTTLGFFGLYYSYHGMVWTGMCIYLDMR